MQSLLAGAFAVVSEAVCIADAADALIWCNPGFEQLLAQPLAVLKGRSVLLLLSSLSDRFEVYRRQDRFAASAGEICIRLNGTECDFYRIRWLELEGSGAPAARAYGLENLSKQFKLSAFQQALLSTGSITSPLTAGRADRCSLTGLFNRDGISHFLANALRDQWLGSTAVIFADLDGFKAVNDFYGHAAGDQLLQLVGSRLSALLRKTDGIGRLGGDEFLVVMQALSCREAALMMAGRIRQAICAPFSLKLDTVTAEVRLGVSLGVALSEGKTATSAAQLIQQADFAMYQAKEAGGNALHIYDQRLQGESNRQAIIRSLVKRSVDSWLVDVLLEPIVDRCSNALVAYQACLSIDHPEIGRVGHAELVSSAAALGYGAALDRVLRLRLLQWPERHARIPEAVQLCLPLSPATLHDPGFVAELRHDLLAAELDPGRCVVLVAEADLLLAPPVVRRALAELRAFGVRIWINHFGESAASLKLLLSTGVDGLCLSRVFLNDLMANPVYQPTAALPSEEAADSSQFSASLAHERLRELVAYLQSSGLQVIASGLNQQVQLDLVATTGLQLVQSELLSEPLRVPIVGSDPMESSVAEELPQAAC